MKKEPAMRPALIRINRKYRYDARHRLTIIAADRKHGEKICPRGNRATCHKQASITMSF